MRQELQHERIEGAIHALKPPPHVESLMRSIIGHLNNSHVKFSILWNVEKGELLLKGEEEHTGVFISISTETPDTIYWG